MKTLTIKRIACTLLIFILLLPNVISASAETKYTLASKNIISSRLQEEINNQPESISVIIWYNDIDHDEATYIAENSIGFSEDEIEEKSLNVSYDDYLNDVAKANIDDAAALKVYVQLTNEERQSKQLLIEKYSEAKLAAEKYLYNQASENIITECRLDRSKIEFIGNYSPVIIATLSAEQIYDLSELEGTICELDYDEDNKIIDCSDELGNLRNSAYITKIYDDMGLSGNGVKVGILENYTVYRDGYTDELPDSRFTNVGTPKYGANANEYDTHSRNTARILCGKYGVAKSALCYTVSISSCSASTTTGKFYQATEALIENDVNVINCSFGFVTPSSAYSSSDKFVDHIALTHKITFVCSAGNYSSTEGYTVLSPGKAYNAITVGAYNNKNTQDYADDEMYSYSCYDECGGCEKPEVIAPANMLGGGTSSSSPFVAGIVALMYEARPSLCNQNPAIVKAILVASCHHKASSVNGNATELMSAGLTEVQGAGAIDAFIALAITCNGNYGLRSFGVNGTSSSTAAIFQPKYGATGINISIAWMRNNTVSDCSSSSPTITLDEPQNLTLNIKQSGSVVGSSNNDNSSVEMVFLSPNSTNMRYDINVTRNTNTSVACTYAYAWSISTERYQHTNEFEQVGYLRNQKSRYYLTASSSSLTQNSFSASSSRRWILNKTSTYYYDLESLFNSGSISVGSTLSNNDKNVILNSTNASNIRILQRPNGSVTIYTPINGVNYALSVADQSTESGASIVWSPYSSSRTDQKWYIQKFALQRGDVDTDYAIETDDANLALTYAGNTATPTAIQKFLADFDGNKTVSSTDARHILRIAQGLE